MGMTSGGRVVSTRFEHGSRRWSCVANVRPQGTIGRAHRPQTNPVSVKMGRVPAQGEFDKGSAQN